MSGYVPATGGCPGCGADPFKIGAILELPLPDQQILISINDVVYICPACSTRWRFGSGGIEEVPSRPDA